MKGRKIKMGIFRSYDKPGPGVDKDAPKKKGLFLYLELLKRKFGRLMQVSMLSFLCSIPMLVILSFIVFGFTAGIMEGVIENMEAESVAGAQWIIISFFTTLICVLWGSGPASAGMAYVTRCFTREEHSWVFSDFFQRMKENFKQGIIVSAIDIVLLIFGGNAVYFYFVKAQQSGAVLWMILCYVSCMMLIIYTFMHMYIYQIMVTYECKLKDLYKNSLILALGKAPMNLILVAVSTGIVFLLFNFLNPLFALILIFLLFMGFARFPLEFYAARTISRVVVSQQSGEEQ